MFIFSTTVYLEYLLRLLPLLHVLLQHDLGQVVVLEVLDDLLLLSEEDDVEQSGSGWLAFQSEVLFQANVEILEDVLLHLLRPS